MRTLTPTQLKNKVENILKRYDSNITMTYVRHIVQLSEIKYMPDSNYCGVFFDKSFGIIAYIAGKDNGFLEAHEDVTHAYYYNATARPVKPLYINEDGTPSSLKTRQSRVGRPKKDEMGVGDYPEPEFLKKVLTTQES